MAYLLEDVTAPQNAIQALEAKVATGNAHLDEALQRVVEASEAERQQIGRELHDSLCQELAGMAHLIEDFREVQQPPASESAPPGKAIANLAELVRRIQQRMRDFAHCLDLGPINAATFPEELAAFAASMDRVYGIPCELTLDAQLCLAEEDHYNTLMLIIREAVFNAVRHAQARHIWIDLIQQPTGRLVLSITNDGAPFSKSAAPEGMGLRHMRRRAEGIGGTLTITRQEEDHTVVQIQTPGKEEAKDNVRAVPKDPESD